tara:strand:+ start:2479 stop:3249 length:771 start_codon:yes stop_codon:yes gene_type:complete
MSNLRISYKDKHIEIEKDSEFNISLTDDSKNFISERCKSYEQDEPKTIKWIESFTAKSVFYDVGSNIGGFSFIASMIHQDIKVYSFEPNFMNFYTQIKTSLKNNIQNIFSFNLAINKNNKFDYFKYDKIGAGTKGTFGEELKKKMVHSDYGNPFKRGICCEVGILGISLDTLVYDFGLEVPNYLKIDVDGNELLVLQGAKELLKNDNLKEIFIEVDDKIYDNNEIEKFMENYLFDQALNINVGTSEKPMRMILYKR